MTDYTDAACRPFVRNGIDLWFPPYAERAEAAAVREREAKAVCATCPVMPACRAAAIADNETEGVWGGLTPNERETGNACGDKHGTTAGRQRHVKVGQKACRACADAWAKKNRERQRVPR